MEDPTIKKAFEVWDEFSRDERKWWEYESRRKAILDENSFKKGIERVVRKEVEQELLKMKNETERLRCEAEQYRKEAEQYRNRAEQARSEIAKYKQDTAHLKDLNLPKNIAEIAKKLLDMKMDLAQIVQVTGLPLEVLQKLQREMN